MDVARIAVILFLGVPFLLLIGATVFGALKIYRQPTQNKIDDSPDTNRLLQELHESLQNLERRVVNLEERLEQKHEES
ncbi:MAG TPA: hypothetical protein PKY35_05560 [Candidatus Hydrogenedentes bacterium]|nr:hypothetical protein [Candidatus Hydrogenedentota bacterium]HOL76478.1 hypothetical protein [Candidatus Hydrogenedentota bacterium]HPO85142.1 hypothetical protein [Candidatus Hydrogenedentota bacterium]